MSDENRTRRPQPSGGGPSSNPGRKRGRRLITRRTRASTVLLGILTTILVGWVLHVGAGILQPLVIAFLLANVLQPVVRGLARWHIPPPVTVIVIVVLFFFGVARLGLTLQAYGSYLLGKGDVATAVGPGFSEEQEELARKFNLDDIVQNIVLQMRDSAVPEPIVDFLDESLSGDDLRNLATEILGGSFGFTKGLVLVVIYMLFIFAEQAVFRRKILAIAGDRASDVLDTISRGVQRYLGVKTLISLVTGSIAYAVLVALEVPYAFVFGILTFLLNYIPTFGSIIAAIFPTIVALAVNDTWNAAIIVVVAYLAINMTLGNFVEPKILGRELNLSPLVIIISVVVWAGLWGPVGTFLAVPLTAGIQIVLASGKSTHPIAVMMSSGPPKEPRRLRRKQSSIDDVEDVDDEDEAAA